MSQKKLLFLYNFWMDEREFHQELEEFFISLIVSFFEEILKNFPTDQKPVLPPKNVFFFFSIFEIFFSFAFF